MSAKRKSRVFRMKQFEVSDARSANKVGVDGVLVGSWATVRDTDCRILDAGCGCGIISLMMAQRQPSADIYGIDIDEEAISEASENGYKSPWGDRLHFSKRDFSELTGGDATSLFPHDFDLIISNPPFFDSGVDPTESMRMTARHSGSLSPSVLLRNAGNLLKDNGRLAFIAPFISSTRHEDDARNNGWMILRKCIVRGRRELQPKRVIYELAKQSCSTEYTSDLTIEQLVIEESPGVYTQDYIQLGQPFYLHF